jgi:hypothetical protein
MLALLAAANASSPVGTPHAERWLLVEVVAEICSVAGVKFVIALLGQLGFSSADAAAFVGRPDFANLVDACKRWYKVEAPAARGVAWLMELLGREGNVMRKLGLLSVNEHLVSWRWAPRRREPGFLAFAKALEDVLYARLRTLGLEDGNRALLIPASMSNAAAGARVLAAVPEPVGNVGGVEGSARRPRPIGQRGDYEIDVDYIFRPGAAERRFYTDIERVALAICGEHAAGRRKGVGVGGWVKLQELLADDADLLGGGFPSSRPAIYQAARRLGLRAGFGVEMELPPELFLAALEYIASEGNEALWRALEEGEARRALVAARHLAIAGAPGLPVRDASICAALSSSRGGAFAGLSDDVINGLMKREFERLQSNVPPAPGGAVLLAAAAGVVVGPALQRALEEREAKRALLALRRLMVAAAPSLPWRTFSEHPAFSGLGTDVIKGLKRREPERLQRSLPPPTAICSSPPPASCSGRREAAKRDV